MIYISTPELKSMEATDPAKLVQTAFCFIDFFDPVLDQVIPALYGPAERLKPWIEVDDACLKLAR